MAHNQHQNSANDGAYSAPLPGLTKIQAAALGHATPDNILQQVTDLVNDGHTKRAAILAAATGYTGTDNVIGLLNNGMHHAAVTWARQYKGNQDADGNWTKPPGVVPAWTPPQSGPLDPATAFAAIYRDTGPHQRDDLVYPAGVKLSDINAALDKMAAANGDSNPLHYGDWPDQGQLIHMSDGSKVTLDQLVATNGAPGGAAASGVDPSVATANAQLLNVSNNQQNQNSGSGTPEAPVSGAPSNDPKPVAGNSNLSVAGQLPPERENKDDLPISTTGAPASTTEVSSKLDNPDVLRANQPVLDEKHHGKHWYAKHDLTVPGATDPSGLTRGQQTPNDLLGLGTDPTQGKK